MGFFSDYSAVLLTLWCCVVSLDGGSLNLNLTGSEAACLLYIYVISLVSSTGVWQLCCDSDDWWRTLYTRSVWHSRTRRLRQITASQLSTDRCISSLFLCSFTVIVWKYQRKGRSEDILIVLFCFYLQPTYTIFCSNSEEFTFILVKSSITV